jgi:hypothetical protein
MSPITFCTNEDINFTIFNYVGPCIRLRAGDIIVFQVMESPQTSRVIKIIKAEELSKNAALPIY